MFETCRGVYVERKRWIERMGSVGTGTLARCMASQLSDLWVMEATTRAPQRETPPS
jgi:hypothetical protein